MPKEISIALCLMVIFEGLPHAFWNNVELPESREALGVMAKFLDEKVR